MKIIRYDGARALVRIPHTAVPLARRVWNGDAEGVPLRTQKSYGTLRKGKIRLRAEGRPRRG